MMFTEGKRLVALVVLFAAVVGCQQVGPELGTVTGTVTMDGQPLEGATIAFHPATGRASIGSTDSQGKYELGFTMNEKGALLGKHTVRITVTRDDEGEEGEETPAELPARFNTESELTADVAAGENVIDFALESAESAEPVEPPEPAEG